MSDWSALNMPTRAQQQVCVCVGVVLYLHDFDKLVDLHSRSPLFLLLPQNPNDISYVYSGYAPLSVRLAQLLARPGWRSIEEVLKMLPGPHFEERQQLPTGLQKKRKSLYLAAFLFWNKQA